MEQSSALERAPILAPKKAKILGKIPVVSDRNAPILAPNKAKKLGKIPML
jgi:hypothetical protein